MLINLNKVSLKSYAYTQHNLKIFLVLFLHTYAALLINKTICILPFDDIMLLIFPNYPKFL